MAHQRVYFVGAGLSAGLLYPVGRTLMERLARYLAGAAERDPNLADDFENSIYQTVGTRKQAKQVLATIKRVLDTYFATDLSHIGDVDVAEFFSMAHTLSEGRWLARHGVVGTPEDEAELRLFDQLAAVTRSYFNDLFEASGRPKDIEALLQSIRPSRDVVVNFNWDEEIEVFLSEDDGNVSYTLRAWQNDGGTLVLKPHGSVGWYDVSAGVGNDDAYLIAESDERIDRYNRRILAYEQCELPIDVDRDTQHNPLQCPPVITAPTFAKRFEYEEQHLIWRDVIDVCEGVTEFVFLGYSLPRDDFLTRAAIRRATAHRNRDEFKCLVVDHDMSDAKFLDFASCFTGFDRNRNWLKWSFGCGEDGLPREIQRRLRKAQLARV